MTITLFGILINYILSILINPGVLGTEENKKELELMITQKPELANVK